MGEAEPQGVTKDGVNSVGQVDGVSDMVPSCQISGSGWPSLEKEKWPLPALLFWRKLPTSSCPDVDNLLPPGMFLMPFIILPCM